MNIDTAPEAHWDFGVACKVNNFEIEPNESSAMKCGIGISLSTFMPYVSPFILFALITYTGMMLGVPQQISYPVKTVLAGACLLWYWRAFKSDIRIVIDWFAVIVGFVVFVAWVGLEGWYPLLGQPKAHEAMDVMNAGMLFLIIRITGAAVVVPVMEELFWRTFALRYLIQSDFLKVRVGKFTWFSFMVVTLAFGLEHHRWLPGIIAGAAYAGVLYRSGNLFSPILAHGVTNFLLGIYVVHTGRWEFW